MSFTPVTEVLSDETCWLGEMRGMTCKIPGGAEPGFCSCYFVHQERASLSRASSKLAQAVLSTSGMRHLLESASCSEIAVPALVHPVG